MVNEVGFVISEEDLASGPGTRLDHSRAFVWQSFIKVRKGTEKVLTKKNVQLESCELSFIWGKMRTAAWEAASQIALRDCSKVLVKGQCNAVKHTFYKRI